MRVEKVWSTKKNLITDVVTPRGIGVEIGVFEGNSARMLLTVAAPSKLHLVDPWKRQEPSVYASWVNADDGVQGKRYRKVVKAFAKEIASGQVSIHRLLSSEAARLFSNDSLDWVSHDGNHARKAVLADLRAYWPRLVPDGLMLVDDYYNLTSERHYGVVQAVADFLNETSDVVVLGRTGGDFPTIALRRCRA